MVKTQKNDKNKVTALVHYQLKYSDGSNSPELVKLLVCSSRNIESQVKDLFKVNEETKISQIVLDALSKKIDELETEIKK